MFNKSFIIAAVIILLQTVTTNAVSLSFEDAGWYSDTGGYPIAVNYFVGDFSTGMPHRNWFVFDLSDIEMTVGSATLRAYNPSNGYSSPDSTETWTLFDVTTDISSLMNNTGGVAAFEDLGSGISYGSIIVSAADNNKFVEVVLNNNALAAINHTSGLFAIGGALTTLSPDTKECVFSASYVNPQVQLVLEPIPEPATIAFLGIGALTLIRRKNNKQSQITKGTIQMKSSKIYSEKNVLANIRMLVIAIALLLAAAQFGFADTMYNDGGVHNINTTMPAGTVQIYNGTTVNAQLAANINGGSQTWAFGVDMLDSYLNVYNNAQISGGSGMWAEGIVAAESIINIYGGTITGGISGYADAIFADIGSIVNIYGGTITGGTGNYACGVVASEQSTVNIYGGTISGGNSEYYNHGIEAYGGTVNIYGSNFNYDLGAISDYSGTITGTLQNGMPLNLTFSQNPGSIVLIPEPATIGLMLLGSVAFSTKKRNVK